VSAVRRLALALTLALTGCVADRRPAEGLTALPPAPPRPRDPWVVRSVLDRRPRVVTVALSRDVWAAYDTQSGTLVKVWKGDVRFDGPVYTTLHGPQPTSEGVDLHDPLADARWGLLRPAAGGQVDLTPLSARWLGYRLADGHVTLHYTLMDAAGSTTLDVQETPECARGGVLRPLGLLRRFVVSGAEAPAVLVLARGSGADPLALGVNHAASFGSLVAWSGGDAEHSGACVRLRPDGETDLATFFALPSPGQEEEAAAASARAAEPAKRAAAPAGSDLVEPFETDGASDADAASAEVSKLDPSAVTVPTEPGVAVRLYDVGEELDHIVPLVAGQTPNVDRVAPRLDLRGERGDFAPLEDQFLTSVSGFLRVEQPGRYVFRLVSDDGSQLSLGGRTLIDHDGLHSAEPPRDAAAELSAGSYPFTAQHFEYGGGEQLTLLWKPPGAAAFEVVPAEALSCAAGEVRVTSPGLKKVIRPLPRGRPGDGQPLTGVHPAFDLATVRPEGFEPRVGGMDFLPDGRLAISTWDADGAVWILDGVQGDDRAAVHARRFAAGLAEPLGLKVVGRRIFVMQKQELTELIDHDGDGTADEYRCVCNAWPVTANFHEFGFGLAEKDGQLYCNLAIAIDPGGRSTHPQIEGRGSVVRVDPDSGRWEFVANGLRAPNGIARMPDGEPWRGDLYVTDNQGDWLPSSKLLRLQEGAFYGNRSVLGDAAATLPVTPPALWLPQNEIGNSPSQPAPLLVGPWRGQVIHGDVTHGGLNRDALEVVDGVTQGCVIPFCQGLEAGVNRLCWGPDGALYVGGIGSTGNWGQEGKQRFGLQRLRFNGKTAFEPLSVSARSDGFEIAFTEPIADDAEHTAWDPDAWFVEHWRYEPTEDYGGEKLDLAELPVRSASVLDGGRRVFLELGALVPGRVVHLRAPNALRSTSGQPLWTTEAWYTLNRVPAGRPGERAASPPRPAPNALTDAERAEGWRLLFDGTTTQGWHAYGKPGAPPAWAIVDGALTRTSPAGDLATDAEFGDFELALDWRIAPGGNSGIMYRVSEDHGAPWETGPEFQVLDDSGHHDGNLPATSAGSCYALYAPDADDTRPVGHWNRARLVVRGDRVEHWLNGALQCRYEIGSEDWKARVAASKFASMPDFGTRARGHVVLQDHGDEVAFRNVRVRELSGGR